MREQSIRLHRQAPDKPPAGQPCNGCGVCCALTTCPVARLRFLRSRGPCPALEWVDDDRRYRCGLLQRPAFYFRFLPARAGHFARKLLSRWISAGSGCDCSARVEDGKAG